MPSGSTSTAATSTLTPAGVPDTWRTGITIDRHPLELWIVIALFAIPGAFITITALDAFFSSLDLLTSTDFGRRFALVVALLALLVASIGVAFLGIAWMLFLRSRVGRGLAYVVAGIALLVVILAESESGFGDSRAYRAEWLIVLGSLVAIVLLAFAPAVREVFTGAGAPAAGDPTSVVIARVCIAAAVWGNGALGLAFLLLGPERGSYYVYGLLEVAVAVVLLVVFQRLREPDRQARVIASAVAGVGIVVSLLGPGADGAALGVVGPVAVLICLWLTPDARKWFGDQPIAISREGSS